MKKFWILLLALAGVLSLAACQGTNEPEAAEYTPSDVQAIAGAGAFSEELEELDGDIAFALYKLADYGVSREELTGCAVLRSAGATCEEAAVLVLDSEEAAQNAEQALAAYVDGQIEANRDYRPAEIPKLENALINRRGSSLLLVIANDLDAAKAAVAEA